MKLSLPVSILAGTLAVLMASAPSAHAQSPIAKANIPFEFAAGGAIMPPGEYTIVVANISGAILLRGSSGNTVALLTTFSGEKPRSTSQLVFERRDGMPHFSDVQWPNESAHVAAPFRSVTKVLATTAAR